MIAPEVLAFASVVVGIAGAGLALAVVAAKIVRAQRQRATAAAVAPHRAALLLVASGEDDDDLGVAHLLGVPSRSWRRLAPAVVAMLSKVRGEPANDLVRVLRERGDLDRALAHLRSRSAVRRARAVHLLGLAHDPAHAPHLLPLLSDRSAEVRLVTVRALGAIGEPATAPDILRALGGDNGQVGVPALLAAEALLSLGPGTASALREGLTSDHAVVRDVAARVIGHSNVSSAAPRLRELLDGDPDTQVRITAAGALGLIGGPEDFAALAASTGTAAPATLRRACAAALGELGHPLAVGPLLALLADPDRRLAHIAGSALVRLGPQGLAALQDVGADGWAGRAAQAALAAARLRGILPVGA